MKIVGKADQDKLHKKWMGATRERQSSGAWKYYFQYLNPVYQLQ